MEVALEAVQLFGGNGYMAEFQVEQLCRDAKVLQIYARHRRDPGVADRAQPARRLILSASLPRAGVIRASRRKPPGAADSCRKQLLGSLGSVVPRLPPEDGRGDHACRPSASRRLASPRCLARRDPVRSGGGSSPSRAARCGRSRSRPTARGSSPSTRPTTASRSSTSPPRGSRTPRRCRSASSRSPSRRARTPRCGSSTTSPTASASSTSASTPPRVVRTLLVGDEPRDIVFAGPGGNRAFITTAHRGQNCPVDSAAHDARASAAPTCGCSTRPSLGATLGGTPLAIVDALRRHAARARRERRTARTVYAAVFHSGNQTTTRQRGRRLRRRRGGAAVRRRRRRRCPAACPAPNTNVRGRPAARGRPHRQVRPATGHWEDELGARLEQRRPLRAARPGRLRDRRDARRRRSRPASFAARRHDPLQHGGQPGRAGRSTSPTPRRGTRSASRARASSAAPPCAATCTRRASPCSTAATSRPRHLNKHIDYDVVPSPPGVKDAEPRDAARHGGRRATARRSTSPPSARARSASSTPRALENDTFVPDAADHIAVSGGGPSGLVLDEARDRLYVLTRFDNASLGRRHRDARPRSRTCRSTTPSRRASSTGRPLPLRRALHLEQRRGVVRELPRLRRLRQPRLGPRQSRRRRCSTNPNPFRVRPARHRSRLPPDEGPDDDAEPARHGEPRPDALARRPHRRQRSRAATRSTRTRRSRSSTSAFAGLLGRGGAARRRARCRRSPTSSCRSPIRRTRSATSTTRSPPTSRPGANFFFGRDPSDVFRNCNGCHALDPANGFFGTDGLTTLRGRDRRSSRSRTCATCTRRSACSACRASAFINAGDNGFKGDQVRGFGFLHDGSVDTLFRFHNATVFNQRLPASVPIRAASRTAPPATRCAARSSSSCSPSTATWRRSSASRSRSRATNGAVVGPRIDLLIARAAAGECDLVVKGARRRGSAAGCARPAGRSTSDRAAEPPLERRGAARARRHAGQELTYTCVPPGSGQRIGVDRDDDGVFDRDERDAGTDPADPASSVARRHAPPSRRSRRSASCSSTAPDRPPIRRGDGSSSSRSRTGWTRPRSDIPPPLRGAPATRRSTAARSRSTTPVA